MRFEAIRSEPYVSVAHGIIVQALMEEAPRFGLCHCERSSRCGTETFRYTRCLIAGRCDSGSLLARFEIAEGIHKVRHSSVSSRFQPEEGIPEIRHKGRHSSVCLSRGQQQARPCVDTAARRHTRPAQFAFAQCEVIRSELRSEPYASVAPSSYRLSSKAPHFGLCHCERFSRCCTETFPKR